MRVLHVIDPSTEAGPCVLRLMADVIKRMESEHTALLIGARCHVDLAVQCGVNVTGSICPPRLLPWTGANALREAADAVERSRGPHDLVHAWTARSAALVALAFGDRPCITTLNTGPDEHLESWHALRTLSNGRQRLLAASTAICRQLRLRGFSNDRVALNPLGVDANGPVIDRRSMRALLAERSDVEIDDDAFLVGLLGEPAARTDANVAATIAARVALSGRRIKLVVHPGASRRLNAAAMMQQLGFPDLIIVDELVSQPWTVAGALDAALFVESRATRHLASSVLPLLWALAHGVPLVAEESESYRDILDEGAVDMVVQHGEINAAAERLTRLYDDHDSRRRFADQGKTLAAELFDIEAYVVRLQHAYDLLLANRAVRLSPLDGAAVEDLTAEAVVA